ncbi:MAG: hypothetical protein PHF37_05720 [Phycisphaerae bacterium]|nr:hypothetical protein [Phycisphaerae bacterium]
MADKYLRLLFHRKKNEELVLWLCRDKYVDESFGHAIRRRLTELMNKDKKKPDSMT